MKYEINVKLERRLVQMWLEMDQFNLLVAQENLSVFLDQDDVKLILFNGFMIGAKND